jgi:hypothetical protein
MGKKGACMRRTHRILILVLCAFIFILLVQGVLPSADLLAMAPRFPLS